MKLTNIILLISTTLCLRLEKRAIELDEKRAVENLKTFLQMNTSHPNPNYDGSVAFLKQIAIEVGLKFTLFQCPTSGTPSVVLSWIGTNNTLPSVVLNSHYDVVPAIKEDWTYDPFSATVAKDSEGFESIYARGALDAKSLGIMHIEATRVLKERNKDGLLRSLHISFMADEEIGGGNGVKCFLESPQWKETFGEIGLFLDEGVGTPENQVMAFYGERVKRGFKITAKGNAGHASQFVDNLATDKMNLFEQKMIEYRQSEINKMNSKKLEYGEVTTSNLNMLKAGTAMNVVPGTVEAWYDVRAAPKEDLEALTNKFKKFAKDTKVSYKQIAEEVPNLTKLEGLKLWETLFHKSKDLGTPLKTTIFPAATDSRHVRAKGIPAVGLTPIKNHPILAHNNDEYIRIETFIQGVNYYIRTLSPVLKRH